MMYYLHNTSRTVANRVQRYSAPSHRGLIQFVGGQRILRGRPLVVGEEWFTANIKEIQAGVDAGGLDVRNSEGKRIDTKTGVLVDIAVPELTIPITVLDSVVTDKPSGIPMPIYPGGAVQSVATAEVAEAAEEEEADVEHTTSNPHRNKKGRR